MKNLTFKEIKTWVTEYNEKNNQIKLLVDKADPRSGGIVLGVFACSNEQGLNDFEILKTKNHYGWNKTNNMAINTFNIEAKQFETIYHVINCVEVGLTNFKSKEHDLEQDNELEFSL